MPKGSWREFDDDLTKEHPNQESNFLSEEHQRVSVSKSKSGRAGKLVTIISGLQLKSNEAKKILKDLKRHCGTGGTWKSDTFELQGDHVNNALIFLQSLGYKPKKSG